VVVRALKRTLPLLVLAALLAGCGSYTKADFTASADAICASTVRATRTITPPSAGHTGAQQLRGLGGYLARLVPLLASESRQIHALKRPVQSAHDRRLLTGYLAALTQSVAEYRQLAQAAQAGDAGAVSKAEATLAASPVTSLAGSYGLRSCAAPGATVA
jgi:hypothetical protein